ncbi:YtxH domain-containing protein [Hymenobacter weizhouensis]|uniref:YtxH domain-containing protein n=1 Tax=Hymenobacter sp. YIM 151500-1 TaxID=2987689 RepID=UPI0022274AD2|nr:YtxH domain-containing protein [Hymenobacter sp. YIM 151500-1]UYZ65130.1 YtxH domain-containing protein [Hymenobacter sp. YIM 151500-1]
MEDTKGKVILSLLVGATAGAVAGLLLAPETGEDTRASLKKSATRLGDSLAKLLSSTPDSGATEAPGPTAAPQHRSITDKAAADELLQSLSTARAGGSTPAEESLPDDSDSDYDGSGGDSRHYPGYRS